MIEALIRGIAANFNGEVNVWIWSLVSRAEFGIHRTLYGVTA